MPVAKGRLCLADVGEEVSALLASTPLSFINSPDIARYLPRSTKPSHIAAATALGALSSRRVVGTGSAPPEARQLDRRLLMQLAHRSAAVLGLAMLLAHASLIIADAYPLMVLLTLMIYPIFYMYAPSVPYEAPLKNIE